jgi:hypothetical protein
MYEVAINSFYSVERKRMQEKRSSECLQIIIVVSGSTRRISAIMFPEKQ